jgi:hypothetical protein
MQLIEETSAPIYISDIEAHVIAVIIDYFWFFNVVRASSMMITAQQVPIRTRKREMIA